MELEFPDKASPAVINRALVDDEQLGGGGSPQNHVNRSDAFQTYFLFFLLFFFNFFGPTTKPRGISAE